MPSVLPSQRWQSGGNRFSLACIAAPTEEPVSLIEMRLHLNIDEDYFASDTAIEDAITSARQEAENITRRAFCTSSWRLAMDRFPVPQDAGTYGFDFETAPGVIRSVGAYMRANGEFSLPLAPIQAITSVTYTDGAGATQTLDPGAYDADLMGFPATLVPVYGTNWPAIRSGRNGVVVTYDAGYGRAYDVPGPIRSWIKLRAADLYRNRESVVTFRGTIQQLGYVDRLLDPYRIIEL